MNIFEKNDWKNQWLSLKKKANEYLRKKNIERTSDYLLKKN